MTGEAPARADVTIRALAGATYEAVIPDLAALVVDAVDSGASVNFMAGLTDAAAREWWSDRIGLVRDGLMTPFVALDGERIVGSVVLVRSPNPNAPHRAEVGKVIVLRSHRRRGIAAALMRAVEEGARSEGRWLLVLDTVSGSAAASLYERLGWQPAGAIPNFAFEPDGRLAPTTYYWKDLR